ncbi:MAG: hypothetical protein IT384_04610 [Deltaproteobacteria bacterium]|nr:hypothetical protein [Deltaproteobacteria bacterium]
MRGALTLLGALLSAGCLDAARPIDLPTESEWVVLWIEPSEGDPWGQLRRRTGDGSLSFAIPEGGAGRLFAYSSEKLGLDGGAALAAHLDRSPVVALEGCGPALPPADRAFAVGGDEVRDITAEPMPSLEAVALPCADAFPEQTLLATPRGLAAVCATATVTTTRCSVCIPAAPCGLTSVAGSRCPAGALELRTELDGALCPVPAGSVDCQPIPSAGGSVKSLECPRSADGVWVRLDLYAVRPDRTLGVVPITPAAVETHVPPVADDGLTNLRSGPLADFAIAGDRIAIALRVGDSRVPSCSPSEDSRILILGLDGRVLVDRAAARPCLMRLISDPTHPGELIAASLSQRQLTLSRLTRDGDERRVDLQTDIPTLADGGTQYHALGELVVTGTAGAQRLTTFVRSSIQDRDYGSWVTVRVRADSVIETARGIVEEIRFLDCAPAGPAAADQQVACADDRRDGLKFYDPVAGALVEPSAERLMISAEISAGPVLALARGGRWLSGNGGKAAAALTLFDRARELDVVPYFFDNLGSVTGLIEVAPDRVLLAASRRIGRETGSDLAFVRIVDDDLVFEPTIQSIGHGVAGRFVPGERCPGGEALKSVWGMMPWTGTLLRIELPCE